MLGPKEDCPLSFDALEPVEEDAGYFVQGVDARCIPFVAGEIPDEYNRPPPAPWRRAAVVVPLRW
ncbi:hypothetical protein [uncultured Thiohalocapsa sp.]|uniref:hypothetical protein n=1 Tax=uncultured Thiohalocapsa sp. TaxID=768990 RepID=UPI0025F95C2B|nr:hypothetical protein [uncultured Thiohalocapsa sp.]